jgi:cytochrome P450
VWFLGVPRDTTRRLQADLASETLRLYPPIGRIGRRPVRNVDLDPPVLGKDTAVFLSPFVTGRDPRWFSEPESFRPVRWNEPAIGEHFATMVLTLKPGGAVRMIVEAAAPPESPA